MVQGSAVKPGTLGIGKLTVEGGVTLDGATTFSTLMTGAGVASTLASLGTPSVELDSPTFVPIVAAGYVPTPGTVFTVIQGNISGTFNSDPEGRYISSGGSLFRITYDQGVVLTDVSPTSTIVQTNSSTSVFGQSVTFTATITDSGANPPGTISFDDGSTVLGTSPVNNSGMATFITTDLAVGLHTITAAYSGDTRSAPSTSAVFPQTVSQAKTKTTFDSSANPSASGQSVTLSATVLPVTPGGGAPTGTITFSDATDPSTPLAVVSLGAGGVATYSTSTLTLGRPSHHRHLYAATATSFKANQRLLLRT